MTFKKTKYISLFFLLFIVLISCSSDDTPETNETGEEITDPDPNPDPDPDPDPNNAECETGKTAVFAEKDGVVVIESENANFSGTKWKLEKSLQEFSDIGYLKWDGADSFNAPGNGLLTYKIRITTPGTYRFLWRSYITIGTNGTEHNDSWLRISDAKHFYGKKGDGHIVYPRGTTQDPIAASEGQANTAPNGSGKDGWFKIYMNTASAWHWQSSTSDNDGHSIFAVFDTPGDYTVEISGRSNGHAIDKFILFTGNTTEGAAKDTNKSVITCE